MFDELIKTLRQMEGSQTISIPLEVTPDSDGYVDKECPAEGCLFDFKVHEEDWRNIVRDEEVFCPSCGHNAPAKSWFTTEQVDWAKKAALSQIKGRINDAMRRDAQRWNSRQPSRSFIRMTLEVKGGHREILLPVASADPMRLKISCPQCECRYSVIGSAYFCPSCGHSAAEHVFDQSLNKVRAAMDVLPLDRFNENFPVADAIPRERWRSKIPVQLKHDPAPAGGSLECAYEAA